MARTANTKLDTPAARKRLPPRSKPYSMTIAPCRMLGYIRAAVGAGRWLSIVEIGRGPSGSALRRQGDLGLADDLARADGDGILSFSMALAAAAGWQPADAYRGGKITVRRAIESYIAAKRAADGGAAAEDARGRLSLHVLREDDDGKPLPGQRGLGDREVASLTLTELRAWRDDLVSREKNPVSRSTANRIIANMKAAFNRVFADEKSGITTDSAWRRLESFKDADSQREEHFSEPEVARLIREARKQDTPFADLLTAAFYTGARYGELSALDVRHVNVSRRTLAIPSGKTGARITTLTEEGANWFGSIVNEREPDEPLLSPSEGGRWLKSMQHRRMKAALAAAKLSKTASFYTLRHTYVSRSIERNMPLTLLAENVGTSLKMIEQNYAHMLAASRRTLVERTAPRLRVVASKAAA
jgi:integrase